MLNLKQIDFKRKENRAEFHIKQRDNYIYHLKEQLALRDKIIKEKLGISFTNFMPANNNNPIEQAGLDILSMQDIDKISKDLILPSLSMTKSSNFPNFLAGAGTNVINSNYGSGAAAHGGKHD